MQTHRKLGWVLTTVVLLAGAACGADISLPAEQSAVSQSPVPTVVKQSSAVTKPAASPSASEYFVLLSTNDSDNAAKAAELAAPKSLAAVYATHLAAVRGANEDGGTRKKPTNSLSTATSTRVAQPTRPATTVPAGPVPPSKKDGSRLSQSTEKTYPVDSLSVQATRLRQANSGT